MARNRLTFDYPDEPTRWVVSYADFTTMLLALFVVLYAVSQIDIAKMRDFSKSLNKSFSVEQSQTKKKKQDLTDTFLTTKASIVSVPIEVTFQDQIDSLKAKLKEAQEKAPKDMVQLDNVKKTLLDDFGTQNEIDMLNSERGLIIRLKDSVLFDSGSADVKKDALSKLDIIAEVLNGIPNSVRVEGYTDDQPIATSKFPSNWELSTARATSIVKELIDKYHFPPEKISAAGYGEYKPLDTNTTPEGRQKNRRVDIVILNSGSQIFEPPSE